jgi:putative transposase
MPRERKHYSAEEKVAILRRHLLDQVPVSDLCEEQGLQPTVFYRWQKEFFENGAAAFQSKERPSRQVEEKQKRIEFLEKKVQTKDEVLAELMAEHIASKKSWGALTKVWVPHDVRDQVVDFVRRWSEKTEISAGRFLHWLGVRASKFYDWRERYGRVNEHNSWVPRDFWLEPWEKEAMIGFHRKNPLEGYRRLTFMMLDADIVAVSPSSVWRVLQRAGLLSPWKHQPSRMGTGFEQPPHAHQHWHIDVSYINVSGKGLQVDDGRHRNRNPLIPRPNSALDRGASDRTSFLSSRTYGGCNTTYRCRPHYAECDLWWSNSIPCHPFGAGVPSSVNCLAIWRIVRPRFT